MSQVLKYLEKEYYRLIEINEELKVDRRHDEEISFRINLGSMLDNFQCLFDTVEGQTILINTKPNANSVTAVQYIVDCFNKREDININSHHVGDFNFFIKKYNLKAKERKMTEII